MSTTETGLYPETGNDRAAALARAACEAFWAAVGAGPETQEPTAAWDWAFSQNTTRAWEAAAKAAAGPAERERDEARAEFARVRSGAETLGKVVCWQAQSMEAARIEMIQSGPEKAMQWILNSLPDVDDNDPEDQWNGTETAREWLDRQRAADRAWEAAKAAEPPAGDFPCCTGCGPSCGCGGSPHETGKEVR